MNAALSRPRHDAAHAEGAEGAVFLDEAQGLEVGVELLQPRVFDAPRECGEVVEEALGATFALGDDAHEVVVDVVRASSSGDVAAANEPGKERSGLIIYILLKISFRKISFKLDFTDFQTDCEKN